MHAPIVQIQSISLTNFKNVAQGKIDINNRVLGIYGQNGSGKTALIDSLGILKFLLSNLSLESRTSDYILCSAEKAKCEFQFSIKEKENYYEIVYLFELKKSAEFGVEISFEQMTIKTFRGSKKIASTLKYDIDNLSSPITPVSRWNGLVGKKKEHQVELEVSRKMAQKERRSFLFSKEFLETLKGAYPESAKFFFFLHDFAFSDLFIVHNNCNSPISLDFSFPLNFKHVELQEMSFGNINFSLTNPNIFPEKHFQLIERLFKEINVVLGKIIPGLQICIKNYGPQAMPDGSAGIRFELLSLRNKQQIPLRYESEGIKKILSILNLLISVYNKPSFFLAIDEMDSGVFEYLLGEILEIMGESAQGRLLFTSHNLRPLEMIAKESLVFTTTNPANRYIHLTGVKTNNNLRDVYLRSINLGGQKESIYEETDHFEINRAFKKAGGIVNGKD